MKRQNNRAVSVLELVVVMGIIVALISIAVPAVNVIKDRGSQTKIDAEIAHMDTALLAFFSDRGGYPHGRIPEMVAALGNDYFSFDPERLSGGKYLDPLGGEYIYICPAYYSPRDYILFSTSDMKDILGSSWFASLLGAAGASGSTGGVTGTRSTGDILPIDVIIGEPESVIDKEIWGLAEPVYDLIIKAALSILRETNTGHELAVMINIANIPIGWDDLSDTGVVAYYDTCTHDIVIDINYAYSINVVTSILAHEATHVKQHLNEGGNFYDSIHKEYEAFKGSAEVWGEIKGAETDALMDYVQELIGSGEEEAKEVIRQSYPGLPEY